MNKDKHGHITVSTENGTVEYYDIMFASYDIRIMKAERKTTDKNTGKVIYWQARIVIPEEWISRLGITDENLLDVYPYLDEGLVQEFTEWLDKELLNEKHWWEDVW